MDIEAICLGFKSWVILLIAWWPLVSYLPFYLMCRMNWIPAPDSQGCWEGRVCSDGQKSTIYHPHQRFWNISPGYIFQIYIFLAALLRCATVKHCLISCSCCCIALPHTSHFWNVVTTPYHWVLSTVLIYLLALVELALLIWRVGSVIQSKLEKLESDPSVP